jgi:archaellum biogenesis protein FlaJ (TadC family)
VGTVVETLLKKIVDLTFKFTTSHQDALDMIAEQTTDAMIDNHDERKTH